MPVAEEAGIQNGDMVRLGEKSKEEMASELNKLQSVTTPSGRKVRGGDGRKRVGKRQNDKEENVHHRQYGSNIVFESDHHPLLDIPVQAAVTDDSCTKP